MDLDDRPRDKWPVRRLNILLNAVAIETKCHPLHLYIGVIVHKGKEKLQKYPNMEQWTNALLMFSVVFITSHPAQTGALIKYMLTDKRKDTQYICQIMQ